MSILNTQQIQEILPHRYPMLMLDTVEELVPGERAVAIKNISVNEEIFQGHFLGIQLSGCFDCRGISSNWCGCTVIYA